MTKKRNNLSLFAKSYFKTESERTYFLNLDVNKQCRFKNCAERNKNTYLNIIDYYDNLYNKDFESIAREMKISKYKVKKIYYIFLMKIKKLNALGAFLFSFGL